MKDCMDPTVLVQIISIIPLILPTFLLSFFPEHVSGLILVLLLLLVSGLIELDLLNFLILSIILIISSLIAIYIYVALALSALAKKIGIKKAGLAWVPFANFFFRAKLAKYPWQYGFLNFLAIIPVVGSLVPHILNAWWFWKISEQLKKPGWLGVLMVLPVINLFILGYLAWGK